VDLEPELPEPPDHVHPPLVVGPLHLLDVGTRVAQGRDARNLHEAVRGYGEVLVQAFHDAGELFREDQVAEPPPGHGVELGKAVYDEGAVRELEDRPRAAPVHQAVVYLVREDELALKPGDLFQVLLRHHDAGRVGRRVDKYGLGPFREHRADLLRPVPEPVVGVRAHLGDAAAHRLDEVGIAGIVRVGEDHLLIRLEDREHHEEHGRRRARGHEHPVRADLHAVLPVIKGADLLAQLQHAHGVRVMGLARADRPDRGLAHDLRGLEIGLADLEVYDVLSFVLQLFGPGHHVHHHEGLYAQHLFRDHLFPVVRIVRAVHSLISLRE